MVIMFYFSSSCDPLYPHSFPTRRSSDLIDGDVVRKIKKLKQEDGPELQVHGSGNLIQTLLENDLVDELWLKIYPITLGAGKRLFGEGTKPAGFRVLKSSVSPNGVIVASYGRAGDVMLGTVELTASGQQVIRS